ncbi:MAG: Flp pilus assembly protein CpaB [Elusimicrobiales bacterium]|jgi:pilus assembly protein CpaB|nr:Flp pilus assembly protein CpaB [Elusimicrobiales bacterium]HOL62008.1 Flp pilus assembly protein CpaB [Elusimicrobiales bacterium]HPO95112.1 Flp pilus assembly protein CpaB [Elusimicrobiales bacterium]
MEKKQTLIPLLLAIIAASLYWWILSSKERELSKAYEVAQVLVAKYDLPARTILKPDLVEVAQIPRKFIEKDSYEIRNPSDIKLVTNLVTAIRIPKGNQITQSALLTLTPEAGLSVKVPPGYRGATLAVDSDLIKLIKPGDRVDILVTFDAIVGDKKEKVTATILQNVLVLGVGSNLGQGITADLAKKQSSQEAAMQSFSDKGVLSLALNPIEAQYLSLSQEVGKVGIVVRALGDVEVHYMEIASFKKLIKS